MKNTLAIIGDDGTLTRHAIELAMLLGYQQIDFYADVTVTDKGMTFDTYPKSRAFEVLPDQCFIALTDIPARIDALQHLSSSTLVNLIHPTAYVSRSAELATNIFVGPQAVVGTSARVGQFVVQNALSSIEHDNVIGEHCFLGTGAILCGRVTLGTQVLVGGGATVKPGITVGEHVTIGTGAVLVKNAEAGGTYIGNPARRMS